MSDPIWLLPAAAQLLAPFVSVTTVTLVEGDWVVILRKKMNIFLNIQLFQKRPSPKQLSEYLWNREDKKDFCRVRQNPFLLSLLCAHPPHPWFMESMENAAFTSPCNRTGVHFGGAVQNARTHNAPPVAGAMGLRNGRGISANYQTNNNNNNNISWAIQFDFYPQRRNC